MNPLQAYQKVDKAACILAWSWLLKNVLGLVSTAVFIYLIWWQWHLGVFGLIFLLCYILLVNFFILPAIFRILNKPFVKMAKSGVFRLGVLGVIDESMVLKLVAHTKVQFWPREIANSMTKKEFQERIMDESVKKYSNIFQETAPIINKNEVQLVSFKEVFINHFIWLIIISGVFAYLGSQMEKGPISRIGEIVLFVSGCLLFSWSFALMKVLRRKHKNSIVAFTMSLAIVVMVIFVFAVAGHFLEIF